VNKLSYFGHDARDYRRKPSLLFTSHRLIKISYSDLSVYIIRNVVLHNHKKLKTESVNNLDLLDMPLIRLLGGALQLET
jgi:gentisate 1,2-dioxygenase